VIRIAICDDYPDQTQLILALLDKYKKMWPNLKLRPHTFDSGAKLMGSMANGLDYQLMLLDILMPGLSGIELAREIRKHDDQSVIIFLTASKDYALDAYGVSAIQYIVKPITENNLFPILNRVIPMITQEKERYFLLSTPESERKIPLASIVYVELNERKLCIFLENGEKLHSRYLRKPFAKAVEPLLRDSRFISPHNSFVLNLDKAIDLKKDSFVMNGQINVPVSRFKYKEVKKLYLAYINDSGKETAVPS
jgi:DNA-binding LytR/AlgR family response regulator